MVKGNGMGAVVMVAALAGAVGSAWAGETAPGPAPAWLSWVDPAAVGAVALLVIAVALTTIERRRRRSRQRDMAPNAGRSAKVTPISVEREPRLAASGSEPARRAAGRQR
jgi:flagellar biosynthesis/type III secretory pathway M-ring protein FliF/YscJ